MIRLLILLILLTSSCSNGKRPDVELKALDNFWKLLGQNSELEKVKKDEEKQK
jgi:hypothetical protein|tara:strand:+ start:1400 stop:1558 length:159 start_codon:yes stop_codon:yes gene_type:complete